MVFTTNFGFNRLFSLAVLMLFVNPHLVKADYISKSVVGNFEDASSWYARSWGDAYPQVDGNVTDLMVVNGVITRYGALNPVAVNVYGTFIVSGNYTNNQWGGLVVKSGGKVEIFGDLAGSAGITVELGGVLIVHGSLSSSGSSVSISGDIIVLGNFTTSSGTTVTNSGNLIVGGNFSHSGGGLSVNSSNLYIMNPDAVISHPGWGDINSGNYGDGDDFVANESGNSTLYDLVVEQLELVTLTYSWIGSLNSSWNNSGNWDKGQLPTSGSNVIINDVGNAPIVESGTFAYAKNLTMGAGVMLVLNPGACMSVSGNLANNGATVFVKNTVSAPTSLLINGSISAPIKVEWVYPTGRYYYIGLCVDGQSFSVQMALETHPYVYKYSGTSWVEITDGAYAFNKELEGYSAKFNGVSDAISSTGSLRMGNYSTAINGWNLIANPYSTYLDLESAGLSLGNALTTIWTTTNASGSTVYATYNISTHVGANGGTRYVAPGQAFWVRNYSASNLSIDNTVRTHATGSLKAASMLDDVLRLTLSKGITADEAVVVFRSIGNETYSAAFDSEKRFTTGASEVSLYTQKDSRKLIINALPDEDLARRIVPLYLNVGSANVGTLKMSATNLSEFMPDIDVYLLDKITGETVNLREKSEYSFTSAAVSAQNRFELSFAPKPMVEVPTDIANGQTDGIRITALGLGNKAIVKVIDAAFIGKVTIEVMDALGKLHGSTVSETARTEVGAPSNTQFYIVKVTYRNKVQTFKIVTAMD